MEGSKLDQEQLFHNARKWYPIGAAILSSFLNFLSFMIGIGWSASSLFWVIGIALVGTMTISGIVVWLMYKISVSAYSQEFTILESRDEYQIESPEVAIHRRIVKIKANESSPFYVAYPPDVDGEQQSYRAYQINSSNIYYNVSLQRVGGKKAIFIYLGRRLKKGEVVDGLCLECKVVNSFGGNHEGVSVSTDPGQKKCLVQIILPSQYPPLPAIADWFILYGRNQTPLQNGTIDALRTTDGKYLIAYDFSNSLSPGMSLRCAISWHWQIS